MILIDEKPPDDPLQAEVVLHVRRHLRRSTRAKSATAASDLGLLFGLTIDAARELELSRCLARPDPIAAAAELIAARTSPTLRVVSLGRDPEHTESCRDWLLKRKAQETAFDSIVASDLRTLLSLSMARDLATTPTLPGQNPVPILIEGETGTGKELLAEAIHQIAMRHVGSSGGFHPVQVSGLSEDIINDELFGHVKGAFTGARNERPGRLEAADKGTLLIDEVGDLPPPAQVRLLRFLQDQKFSRQGENRFREVAVRVVAATWHNLEEEAKAGRFRLDLLHRLRGGWLRLPPLRERKDAFTAVVPELLARMAHAVRPQITRSATDALALYSWPGNLRELSTILRVAAASASGDTIRVEDLPAHIQRPYLEQPIHARSTGFLSDEVVGQPLSAELVRARAEIISESLEAAERPLFVPGISEVMEFFQNIPDPSQEHETTVKQLEGFLKLGREASHRQFVMSHWEKVLSAELPPTVRDEVSRLGRVAQDRHASSVENVRAAQVRLSHAQSPWWALWSDITKLPVFRGQDQRPLLKSVMGLVTMAYTFAPDFAGKVKAIAARGGIPALREELVKAFKNSNNESGEHALDPADNHKHWPKDQWVDLVEQHASKAAASRATGLSDKTISRYLSDHGIPERWGTKSNNGTKD